MPYAQSVPGYDLEAHPGGLILRARSGTTEHRLDRVSGLVYTFCDGRTSNCEIAGHLAMILGDAAPGPKEMDRIITRLSLLGLVEVQPSASAA